MVVNSNNKLFIFVLQVSTNDWKPKHLIAIINSQSFLCISSSKPITNYALNLQLFQGTKEATKVVLLVWLWNFFDCGSKLALFFQKSTQVIKIVPFCSLKSAIMQGQLQIWTEHSTLIFENLKPVQKSKNHFNIIWTSSKDALIFKIWRVRLKN